VLLLGQLRPGELLDADLLSDLLTELAALAEKLWYSSSTACNWAASRRLRVASSTASALSRYDSPSAASTMDATLARASRLD
jgi:hypothetical protein